MTTRCWRHILRYQLCVSYMLLLLFQFHKWNETIVDALLKHVVHSFGERCVLSQFKVAKTFGIV